MPINIVMLILLGEMGIIAGIITGLFPGIHINLVAVIMFASISTLLELTSPLALAVFIVAMSITHTMFDFIPSIFLGAPDENSFLSILPGHQLLLQGHGYAAIVYTLYGSAVGALLIIFFLPLFIAFLPTLYPYIQKTMAPLLILLSIYLIITEKNKLKSTIIFLLAGFLGIAALNIGIKEPLLPLLSGLFGASGLIISMKQKTTIPEQKITSLSHIQLSKKSLVKGIGASIIAAPFTAFLPGLGASQAVIIGQLSLQIKDQREFLFVIGAVNMLVIGLSFITVYAIQ